MIPIEFPEQNVIYAKDQAEYLPLPAYKNETEVISCWKLSWKERFKILFGYNLWVRQMNFNKPLQPQHIGIEYPFV